MQKAAEKVGSRTDKLWHGVKVGPGPGDPGPRDSGTRVSKFKSRTLGPLSKLKSGTYIIIFVHCFYILYSMKNYEFFFIEMIFHE